MEAQGLASASVPTVRQVSTPYNQQIRSTKDYLAAVQSALADTTAGVNQGYDASLAQSQGVDAAANARLAGLGLGADSAGVQAVQGARGDSATQALIANAAAAKGAAAQMPTIAAGQASQFGQVTSNKLLDALASRRDQLSQAFFQALQQAQSQGLAKAQFNQGQYQFGQNMALQRQQAATQASQFAQSQASTAASLAEQKREFNITQKAAAASATAAGFTPNEVQSFRSDIMDAIGTAKKGLPWMGAHRQLVHGDTGKPRWRVPPAPLGAPKEPGQENSIFALYQFLSNRYDPNLQPVILAELKAAYPKSTWNVFVQSMSNQSRRGQGPH